MFIDLTEILQHPYRTGIQRVEREIIKHWPKGEALDPIYFDWEIQRFTHVPKETLDILAAPPDGMDAEKHALAQLIEKRQPADHAGIAAGGLFNPELFAYAPRSEAYQNLSRQPNANLAWLVYDFFPFLLTETNPPGTDEAFKAYRHGLGAIPRQCFISEQTRTQFGTFYQRMPDRVGPAFALGGNGLALESQSFATDRRQFVHLGSIDPRKNLIPIMKAFELLWSRGVDAHLTLIGHTMHHSGKEHQYILNHMIRDRRFKHIDKASDEEVCRQLRTARATIFVSTQEGYGLPPVESLAAGIPAIVSSSIPSMDMLPPGGRITLNDISPETIAAAVERLLDDDAAQAFWAEAARLWTPTWDTFVRDLSSWLLR